VATEFTSLADARRCAGRTHSTPLMTASELHREDSCVSQRPEIQNGGHTYASDRRRPDPGRSQSITPEDRAEFFRMRQYCMAGPILSRSRHSQNKLPIPPDDPSYGTLTSQWSLSTRGLGSPSAVDAVNTKTADVTRSLTILPPQDRNQEPSQTSCQPEKELPSSFCTPC